MVKSREIFSMVAGEALKAKTFPNSNQGTEHWHVVLCLLQYLCIKKLIHDSA